MSDCTHGFPSDWNSKIRDNVLRGSGCPSCMVERIATLEEKITEHDRQTANCLNEMLRKDEVIDDLSTELAALKEAGRTVVNNKYRGVT